jgi:hypothetical protein
MNTEHEPHFGEGPSTTVLSETTTAKDFERDGEAALDIYKKLG